MATDTGWQVYRNEWYNDRIMETFINAPIIDKQNDLIPTDVLKDSMDFYMKYGVYSYQHEEIPIGVPLAYRIEDNKVKVRYGIHNQLEMHDNVWKEISEYGTNGASSIRGETLTQDIVCPEGADTCFNKINDLGLWSVSWVGDNPANVEAKVTNVAVAKSKSDDDEEKQDPCWAGYEMFGFKIVNGKKVPNCIPIGKGGVNDSKNKLRTVLDLNEADKTVSFINDQSDMDNMSKVEKDADCGCGPEKEAEKTDAVSEEIKSEETIEVEVIAPEDLPDVVEEEEKQEKAEELTLESLATEMKAMREKMEELSKPSHYDEEKEEEEKEEEEKEEEMEKSEEPSLDVVMKSLKKYGISVYAGAKRTPAPTENPKTESFDWNNIDKSWDELEGGN